MTTEEILKEFKDINHAYNNCTKYDTLKRMLEELEEEYEEEYDVKNLRIKLENAEDVIRGLKSDLADAREEIRNAW